MTLIFHVTTFSLIYGYFVLISSNSPYLQILIACKLSNKLQLKGRQTQLIIEVYKQLITLRATSFIYLHNHHQAHTKGHLAMS